MNHLCGFANKTMIDISDRTWGRRARSLDVLLDLSRWLIMSRDLSHPLGVYLHLAQASLRGQRPLMRDRMLVLAGVIATEIGLTSIAAYCRDEILRHNPRHIVRRWPSVAIALADEDFLAFLKQIRRRYPTERAERMLDALGFVMGQERETYYSDAEYAAAILGTTPDDLDRRFETPQT